MPKAEQVCRRNQSRPNACHWPGCKKQVQPSIWCCQQHWWKLPVQVREMLRTTYRPNLDAEAAGAYAAAESRALDWIARFKSFELARARGVNVSARLVF